MNYKVCQKRDLGVKQQLTRKEADEWAFAAFGVPKKKRELQLMIDFEKFN